MAIGYQVVNVSGAGGGGGGGVESYAANISSATTWTITGATHGLGTADIQVKVSLDNGSSYVEVDPAQVSINKSTGDVTITWAVATAGRVLLIA